MLDAFLELPRFHKRLISVVSDALFLFLALWAAFALRLEEPAWVPEARQIVASAITVGLTIGFFIKLGLYRAVIRYLGDEALLTIIYGVVLSSVTLIVLG